MHLYLPALLVKDVYSRVIDSGKAFQSSRNVSARNWHARSVEMLVGAGLLNVPVPLLVAKVQ